MTPMDLLALVIYLTGVYLAFSILHRETKFLDPLFRLMDRWRDG